MRVSYIAPSVSHFDGVFTSQKSREGGLRDIKVLNPNQPRYYRVEFLFGILGSLVRRSITFLTNYLKHDGRIWEYFFEKNYKNDFIKII